MTAFAAQKRALFTAIGLMLLRRRLQRSSGPAAAVGLVALDLLGPRIVRVRNLLPVVLALTIVGALVAGFVWWALRRRSEGGVRLKPDPTREQEGVRLQPDPAVT